MKPSEKHIMKRIALIALLVSAGCGGVPTPNRSAQTLPFLVELKEVRVGGDDDQDRGADPAVPARFGDVRQLTRELADALEATGVFSWVTTESELAVPADLELSIEIVNRDFGPGSPTATGAVTSTLAWLVAGQFSWFIDNREYPESNVTLRVRLRPSTTTIATEEDWFGDELQVRELELSFLERADMRYWFLNVFVPPWWGDGDPETAGRSLAGRTVGFFADREPERIFFAFPTMYFHNTRTFLLYDERNGDVVIVSGGRLGRVQIWSAGSATRELRGMELSERALEKARDRDSVLPLLAEQAVGLEVAGNHLYRIPLRDDESGYVRVRAVLDGADSPPPQWTIFRDTEAVP